MIVGIYADALVAQRRGGKMPIMNMQERVLSVLGCRHVDDALIDAPWVVSTEMIESFGICVVARGDATVPLSAHTARAEDISYFTHKGNHTRARAGYIWITKRARAQARPLRGAQSARHL